VRADILHLGQRAQPLAARLECGFAQHPVGDALIGPHLEIESDAAVRERRAGYPWTRVRDAEIRHAALRCTAALREPRTSGGKRRGWCEARLLALREENLARKHAVAEQPRECAQRERNPGEARVGSGASRAEREAPRIRKPCSEGTCGLFRPLTTQVGLI